jgi:hypothetical protein
MGPEHLQTSTIVNNLAALYQAQGDLAGARLLFERALAITENVRGPEHPYTLAIRKHLAALIGPPAAKS